MTRLLVQLARVALWLVVVAVLVVAMGAVLIVVSAIFPGGLGL